MINNWVVFMSKVQKYDLLKILIAIYCFFTAMGMNLVVFPVILKENNFSETYIGLSVITELLAGIVFAVAIVKLLQKIGAKKFLLLGTSVYFVIMMLIGDFVNFTIWLGYILLVGIYWYGFSMIKQSWYNTIIPNKGRNLMISINTIVLSFGFASGSYIVSFMGSLNPYNLDLAFVFSLIALIAISLIKTPMPKIHDKLAHDVTKYFKVRPFLYFSKFAQEIITISILSFIVIYAINIGYSYEHGAILAGLYSLSAVLHLLSARILDRYDYKNICLIVSCSLICILMGLFLLTKPFYIIAFLCFLSGFLTSFYYIGCEAEVNYFFADNDRVGANNALSFVTNLGGVFGCVLTGFLMSCFGDIGFVLPSILGQMMVLTILLFLKFNLLKTNKVKVS